MPAWFYFMPFIGMLYGQWLQWDYPLNYERVILEDAHEGKMVIDLAQRKSARIMKDDQNEKVVILLHGVAGSAKDSYIQRMVDYLTDNGFNVIAMNHYGAEGVKD